MTRIAIIGGGPVGTSCACLLKEKDHSLEVHLFEQRPMFVRNQILLLSKETLKTLPDTIVSDIEERGCYVTPPPTDTRGTCYRRQNSRGSLLLSVRISILEEALWNYAQSIGVVTHRPPSGNMGDMSDKAKEKIEITDPRLEMFDIIIGAGGRNDIVREYLKIPVTEKPISRAIIFTWTPEKHSTVGRQSQSYKRRGKRGSQDRYRLFRSTDTNYYGTVQLSPKEMKESANLPPTGTIDMISNPSILQSFGSLLKYYNIRPDELPFARAGSQVKYTMVPITLYHADDYVGLKALPEKAQNEDKKIFLIIGDAVLGVHFFSGTGVNSGINMARVASDAIIDFLHNTSQSKRAVNEMFDDVRDEFGAYIKEALKKSRNVVIPFRKVGKCTKNSVKELRKMAKRYHYRGITTLPKQEMCMIMADHIF